MTPSLERLNELVRQAEAKSRAKKLGSEVQQAAVQLREAEERARVASMRLREVRPAMVRKLEKAETDEQQLKELIKKLAQFKTALDPAENPENLVDDAKAEIDRARKEAQSALEEIGKEAEEARKGLRVAMEHYHQVRRELDRLQPALAENFSSEDKLLWEAEVHFPGGQLQALAREVEAGAPFFGSLSRAEQYAQLKVWIGRHRQFQEAADHDDADETTLALAQRVFHQLKNLSKTHEPGYIEAFRLDFQTDWAFYISEAQGQLLQATEAVRMSKDREQLRGEAQARDVERTAQARELGRAAMNELKALMTRVHLPEEGLDEFLELLKQTVNGLGASDPELLDLVMPFREHVSGGNGLRALRRSLDRIKEESSKDSEPELFRAQFQDVLSSTSGRRAVMIGGSVREDVRKTLQRLFEFDRLDWEPYEDAKPAALDSMESRVRNHGVDLVLILRSFVGHHVTERLRPLCEQHDIPCLMVDRGYGLAQVGETLRKGLVKQVG